MRGSVYAGSWEARDIGYHWNCAEILKLHLRVCVHVLKLKDNFSEVNFLLLLGVEGGFPG